MYFGGIWGGQLQRWASGAYKAADVYPAKDQPALSAKVARLGDDMVSFAEAPQDVVLLDESGKPLARRRQRHAASSKRRGCTSTTARTTSRTRPATRTSSCMRPARHPTVRSPCRGKILEPVLGWTNHHSIVEFQGKWYLFYHDAQISGGQTHLRNIKVTELKYRADGSIVTIDAYIE